METAERVGSRRVSGGGDGDLSGTAAVPWKSLAAAVPRRLSGGGGSLEVALSWAG